MRKLVWLGLVAALLAPGTAEAKKKSRLDRLKHIVVIYEENHSFDNLYGEWPGVNGLPKTPLKQVDQAGTPYSCLLQNDVNLTPPPLPASCTDAAHGIT